MILREFVDTHKEKFRPEVSTVIDILQKHKYDVRKVSGSYVHVIAPEGANRYRFLINLALNFNGLKDANDHNVYEVRYNPRALSASSLGRVEITINEGKPVFLLAKPAKMNAGLQFESKFYTSIIDYINGKENSFTPDIIKLLKIAKLKDGEVLRAAYHVGGNNTRRPLYLHPNGWCSLGSDGVNIGSQIADIAIEIASPTNPSGRKVYLSLKKSATVSFANISTKTVMPEEAFLNFPEQEPPANTKKFLEFWGINWYNFMNVFELYEQGKKLNKELKEDATAKLNTKEFRRFLKEIIGCGYILVHDKGSVELYDMTESYLNKLVHINKATVRYPQGNAKSVYVDIDCPALSLTIQFRDRNGRLYPSSFSVLYKFK